jgi:nucleoside-diphosphate-sugar epimerase
MKIAVTGGSGRIGKAVIDLALNEGHSVVCIDRVPHENQERIHPSAAQQSNFIYIQADITDYAALESAFRGCDALVHQAAIPSPGHFPDHVVHNNNVAGSYNALRAAVEVGVQRICQASSVNATGLAYSRLPHFEFFPLDEEHPTYNEDPYSLSKWICEEQASSIARRYETLTISSLRFHAVLPERPTPTQIAGYKHPEALIKNLWGYTTFTAAVRACLLSLTANFKGHEVFYIVAPDTTADTPSLELKQKYYPNVAVRGDLSGHKSFFNSSKAERLLGWKHDVP